MNTRIILKVLWSRRQLRRRDRWTRRQLEAHQARSLRLMREHAYSHSPFYRRFHKGLTDRPLDELPILTKALVMEHFDEIVADRSVHLTDVEAHVNALRGNERFHGRYYVASTSGSTGLRGIFLWDLDEWITVLASYNRSFDWAGSKAGLTRRTKMAIVSSTTPWHQSSRVGASVHSPWVPTLRLDSGDPMESIIERLNHWQPEVLVAYASMLRLLAEEQIAGLLRISPDIIFSASEVLTDQTRRRAEEAWERKPFNVYAATEPAGIASECDRHAGMHLFEDLVITEVVDGQNRPVPPGTYGDKVLATVLFSRTMPLIRYEMSDSVRPATAPHCPCGRPFDLIDGIQGRVEDVLRFSSDSGAEVSVQPIVFHRVMDTVPAAGWQVVQEPGGLTVLLSGAPKDFAHGVLTDALRRELGAQGAITPKLEVRRVSEIPKGPMGKAPLIRSSLAPSSS
ncbi:phenylacetate--CoA ligase family protein [Rubrobacter tropicus]|uniref:Phenylacetate--CoA ligase family protein n=1 Tax=Rubrobacter tropicus TaxID=2653851 RepID=A0A6G8QD91_9ACTN|nr:phenylacetate--CoA ligase family protein [Rubrobacter tropicus]QIN84449.1 phenylacetate--CoA ligase family protein [Rubrobacter tropicus]